ncbi:MAG: hypothetical protein Tsb0014_26060 [Pleurocapsa sp.]
MSNHCDRRLVWSLLISAIDNLEQVARARNLTNILWEINLNSNKTEQDWDRVEILLESYETRRDEHLEAALSDLRSLVQIINGST